MDEIESLYVSLGVTPDEASAVEAVNKMTDKIKQSLKSSIYGGKKGVITLPATIEGTYKNGKEIEKEIVDAYTAIYNKAKEMADSSVSLTLKDIEDFKKQINKFGKITAKKRGNDIIANTNNNLKQTISAYQDLLTDLKKQISDSKGKQTVSDKRTRAQNKKSNLGKTSSTQNKITDSKGASSKSRHKKSGSKSPDTGTITDEEIKHDETVAKNTYYNKTGIKRFTRNLKNQTENRMTSGAWSNIDKGLMKASDWGGPHGSQMASEAAKSIQEFSNTPVTIKKLNGRPISDIVTNLSKAQTSQYKESQLAYESTGKQKETLTNVAKVGRWINARSTRNI